MKIFYDLENEKEIIDKPLLDAFCEYLDCPSK